MAIISNLGGGKSARLQAKLLAPTESVQTITPDKGFDGFSAVTISGIPYQYKIAYNIYIHTQSAQCAPYGVQGDAVCGISDPLTIDTLTAVNATTGAAVDLAKSENGLFVVTMPNDDVIIRRTTST
nr:MAG TPA: hypothetical protein [Caudoviricetes sp.]